MPPDPNWTTFPPKVDEAVVEVIFKTVALTPLRVVEVPALVFKSEPPERAIPLVDKSPP